MSKALDALVVGAGPTGLTMAGELARRGLEVRLVDKALEPPPDHSRALGIQARTMELFEQMGIAPQVLARGQQVQGMNFLQPGGDRALLPFAVFQELATPFPGMVVAQQFDTESILASRLPPLGVALERGVELVSYVQDDAGVTATLRRGDSAAEEVRSKWLIGCDGAHSPVRKGVGIAFEGDTYDDQCLLGDVVVDWPLPDHQVYVCPAPRGIVASFPVPGEHRFRMVIVLPEPRKESSPEVSLEEFEGLARELMSIPIQVRKAFVLSRYRLHHRVAARLRQGRVFLAGDAAHIHSPAGGQGMNTGIQDAYNLAWKLAGVEQGRMPAWVLDTYEAERIAVARRLVRSTDRVFGAMAGHGLSGRLLRAVAPRLAVRIFGLPFVNRRMVGFMSQLRIRYRGSPLSVQLGPAPRQGPHAGDRAPDGTLRNAAGAEVRVFELLRGLEHALLLFTGPGAPGTALEQARALATRLRGPDLKAFILGSGAADEYADPDGRVHATYGVEAPTAILIRPDGYVGLRCGLQERALERELARRFSSRS